MEKQPTMNGFYLGLLTSFNFLKRRLVLLRSESEGAGKGVIVEWFGKEIIGL